MFNTERIGIKDYLLMLNLYSKKMIYLSDMLLFGIPTFFTYLSNGKIEVVTIDDNLDPYRWLNRKDSYNEDSTSGTAFLLLTRSEYNSFENTEIANFGTILFTNNHYNILLYDAGFLHSYILSNDKNTFMDDLESP